jgi:hypothetical protein
MASTVPTSRWLEFNAALIQLCGLLDLVPLETLVHRRIAHAIAQIIASSVRRRTVKNPSATSPR